MRILVTYDVSTETAAGKRRLRKVALACLAFGQRVQKSVFECTLTEAQLMEFEHRLLRCISEQEDSLRIYRLREDRDQYLKTYGVTHDIDFDAPLVV
ncbi:MAG: CRISPR-associated endonuclease Cas2 [Thermomicrobiales bacterium]|jgi:CRISPR-associated protein Cas2